MLVDDRKTERVLFTLAGVTACFALLRLASLSDLVTMALESLTCFKMLPDTGGLLSPAPAEVSHHLQVPASPWSEGTGRKRVITPPRAEQ